MPDQYATPWTEKQAGLDLWLLVNANGETVASLLCDDNPLSEQSIGRILACVNALRCIPTPVVGKVVDNLFTAMMAAVALDKQGKAEMPALLCAAKLIEQSGVDLTELLKQCKLESPTA